MMTTIGDNIRRIRQMRHYTQEQLAEQLHITRQTLSSWERGASSPSVDDLKQLAFILDVHVSELIEESLEIKKKRQHREIVTKGISFGSCLAIIVSYTAWNSIPWAILHGFFSWVYVIYYMIRY